MAAAKPASGATKVDPKSNPTKQGVKPGPKTVKLPSGTVRKDN